MRATWMTDVHLNFSNEEGVDAFLATVARESPELLLVGGDTGESDDVEGFLERLGRIAPLYFVLGNHDYYRSSIAEVRARLARTGRWLPALDPIRLTPSTTLVGVDGWGDARVGNLRSPIHLSDWLLIEELRALDRSRLVDTLQALGEEEANLLRRKLAAVDAPKELLVLTHVPPFAEACIYDGRQSDADWLPWFTCIAVGEVLRDFAIANAQTNVTVLCGHTHGRGEHRAMDNLVVHTGGWAPGERDYGNPIVQPSRVIA